MSDEAEERKARALAQQQRDLDLGEQLKSTSGRRLTWSLLRDTGVFGPSYTGDALSGAYAEGRRSVGIQLMLDCQRAAPRLYVQMLAEHLSLPPREAALRPAE